MNEPLVVSRFDILKQRAMRHGFVLAAYGGLFKLAKNSTIISLDNLDSVSSFILGYSEANDGR